MYQGERLAKDFNHRSSRIWLSFVKEADADKDKEWEGIRAGGCDKFQEEVFATNVLIPVGIWKEGPVWYHRLIVRTW